MTKKKHDEHPVIFTQEISLTSLVLQMTVDLRRQHIPIAYYIHLPDTDTQTASDDTDDTFQVFQSVHARCTPLPQLLRCTIDDNRAVVLFCHVLSTDTCTICVTHGRSRSCSEVKLSPMLCHFCPTAGVILTFLPTKM